MWKQWQISTFIYLENSLQLHFAQIKQSIMHLKRQLYGLQFYTNTVLMHTYGCLTQTTKMHSISLRKDKELNKRKERKKAETCQWTATEKRNAILIWNSSLFWRKFFFLFFEMRIWCVYHCHRLRRHHHHYSTCTLSLKSQLIYITIICVFVTPFYYCLHLAASFHSVNDRKTHKGNCLSYEQNFYIFFFGGKIKKWEHESKWSD